MSGDNKDEIKTQGSINIIKEGIPDDEAGKGRAVIMLNSDGVIMIDGPKIVLGSGIEKANGAGTQVCIGVGAKEPIVLGDTLKKLLEELIDILVMHQHSAAGPTGPPLTHEDLTGVKGKLKTFLSKVGKTK
jgi:hypothetical protein